MKHEALRMKNEIVPPLCNCIYDSFSPDKGGGCPRDAYLFREAARLFTRGHGGLRKEESRGKTYFGISTFPL